MQSGFMFRRPSFVRSGLVGLIPLVALLATGCGKSHPPATPASIQSLSNQVMLAIHWVGKAHLARDTNAAYQMEIWNMPESLRLEQQTLDKLARALPALLGATASGDTNVLAGLVGIIRPMLDDLVQAESFAEVRASSNRPVELALAIRLSPERAALWQTNVAVLQAALADLRTNSAAPARSVQFSPVGDWAVLGIRQGESPNSAHSSRPLASLPSRDQNIVSSDFLRRFSPTNPPPNNNFGNLWLELDIDLSRLVRSNSILPSENLPFVHLTLAGEGQTVRTRGEMAFSKPLEIKLEPWNVPTNLIQDPLVSFTAMRGMKSVIEMSSLWRNLEAGEAPNQFFTWAIDRAPFQTYFASPWPNSTDGFQTVSDRILRRMNSSLSSNGWGQVSRISGTNGIEWTGVPLFQPFLRYDQGDAGEFMVGGFSPINQARHLPPELLAQFVARTNTLYYDWEVTGTRNFGFVYVSQALRLISGKAQLEPESVGLKWLMSSASKLGNAATVIHMVDSNHLTFSRVSSAAFTCSELHGLVDWLESPGFPRGLHTFLTPAPVSPHARRKVSVLDSAPPTNGVSIQPGVPP